MKGKVIVKKLIKAVFNDFCENQKFTYHTPVLLLREKSKVLQIICFNITPSGFYCDVAIQPLFIPEENIILSFGNRVNRFGIWISETNWVYDTSEANIIQSLLQIRKLVEDVILSWFTEVGHPSGIVKFLKDTSNKNHLMVMLQPWHRLLHGGFCNLYVGNYQEGLHLLRRTKEYFETNNMKWEWVNTWNEYIDELIVIGDKQAESMSNKLNEYYNYTKHHLGIV